MDPNNPHDDSLDTLDAQGTVVEAPQGNGTAPTPPTSGKKPGTDRGFIRHIVHSANVYVLLLAVIIVAALAVLGVSFITSRNSTDSKNIASQTLSPSALNEVAGSDQTIGDPKQTLNVQSNAVFDGQVLVRSNLQVAGKLQIGSDLSLTGITVAGNSAFDQVQVNKNLAVAGDTALQGQLSVLKGLNVNGSSSFSGNVSAPQVTANSLQLNGDLNLTHHITAGGATPSRSNGTALGSGGTASISGSDTAGSISINTGTGTSAGCFVTVNFVTKFNSTPHVLITPVGSAAASFGYYVNRSTSSFSVCAANPAPSSSNFGFDYFVVD